MKKSQESVYGNSDNIRFRSAKDVTLDKLAGIMLMKNYLGNDGVLFPLVARKTPKKFCEACVKWAFREVMEQFPQSGVSFDGFRTMTDIYYVYMAELLLSPERAYDEKGLNPGIRSEISGWFHSTEMNAMSPTSELAVELEICRQSLIKMQKHPRKKTKLHGNMGALSFLRKYVEVALVTVNILQEIPFLLSRKEYEEFIRFIKEMLGEEYCSPDCRNDKGMSLYAVKKVGELEQIPDQCKRDVIANLFSSQGKNTEKIIPDMDKSFQEGFVDNSMMRDVASEYKKRYGKAISCSWFSESGQDNEDDKSFSWLVSKTPYCEHSALDSLVELLTTGASVCIQGAEGVGKRALCGVLARKVYEGQINLKNKVILLPPPRITLDRLKDFVENLGYGVILCFEASWLIEHCESENYESPISCYLESVVKSRKLQVIMLMKDDFMKPAGALSDIYKKIVEANSSSENGKKHTIAGSRYELGLNLHNSPDMFSSEFLGLERFRVESMKWDQVVKIVPKEHADKACLAFTLSSLYGKKAQPEAMLQLVKEAVELVRPGMNARIWKEEPHNDGEYFVSRSEWECIGENDLIMAAKMQSRRMKIYLPKSKEDWRNYIAHKLKKSVIGQDKAVDMIMPSLTNLVMGLKDKNKAIGCFLFAGSTGTGKTMMAKQLAKYVFGDEKNILQLNLSEYVASESAISALLGAPPCYKGAELGGQLTNWVWSHPRSVILWDEIEKTCPEVQNLLLQIMDEGYINDAHGTRIDFTKSIIIATSNAGAETLINRSAGFCSKDNTSIDENEFMKGVRARFSPEFLNRFNALILFQPISLEQVEKIAKREITLICESVRKEHGLIIEPEYSLIGEVARKGGCNPNMGAREIGRCAKDLLKGVVAELLIKYELSPKLKKLNPLTAKFEGGKTILSSPNMDQLDCL